MALNLSGADKTFRRYAAVESVNHPPIPANFEHQPPAGDSIKPDSTNVFTADATTDLLTTTAHGLVADTPLRFTTTTTLPGGLSLATTYYVIATGLTANAFKVSTALGGSAVDITSAGTGTHSWARYLTAPELVEINQWLKDHLDGNLTLPGSIMMKTAWLAYWNDPKHKGWVIDNDLERHWQWVWRSSDHADASQPTIPPSADSGGAGSGAPAFPANVSPN